VKFILVSISLLSEVSLFAQDTVLPPELADPGPVLIPDPVPFSFETPGWYILATLLILLLVYYSIKWMIQYRKNAYRREALARLSNLQHETKQDSNPEILSEALVLLKQVALHAYGRQKVAMLSGKAWFDYLSSTGKNTPFGNYEITITDTIYRNKAIDKTHLDELLTLSKKWIKTHA
jgi:hypothetical protein